MKRARALLLGPVSASHCSTCITTCLWLKTHRLEALSFTYNCSSCRVNLMYVQIDYTVYNAYSYIRLSQGNLMSIAYYKYK